MNIKTVFQSVQWSSVVVALFQIFNDWAKIFPGVEPPKWLPYALILLASLLPSLSLPGVGSVGHRMAFGEAQVPGDRTTEEVHAAAVEVKAGLIAAAPAGQLVSVPSVVPATATGTKPEGGTP